ncbi:LysR family transcriptional regulator [Streptomyces alanosinicus]|uniref:LysR family transcriptional regulator n=1 Tax=Streptomyces alanosinicus TaxID=68171 RepID=A0A918YTU3_9ACTN|nr:LysR family transcriptional regulator [Streptomyces alanosinicus]GHE13707.1 LysR family transcriptional regulator [Streptomyces alanosinicus]
MRDIEIFLTLAQELHFGRTAERLHVSAARVSQAIKKQERTIGAALFERTSRQVTLTPVGRQLRDDLLPVYQGLQQSLERARTGAQGKTEVLRIGMMPSNAHDLRPFWDTFRSRHPQWGLRIRHSPFIDPFGPLRSGDVDILVSWTPVEEPDLTVGPVLFTEHRVALAARDHILADRTSVSVEALGDHGVIGSTSPLPDYWEDAFIPFQTPSGRTIERNHTVGTLDELYTIVAVGEALNSLGAHVTRYHVRPDIIYLPLHDAPHLHWSLVWRTGAETDLIRAFAQVVRDLGTPEL